MSEIVTYDDQAMFGVRFFAPTTAYRSYAVKCDLDGQGWRGWTNPIDTQNFYGNVPSGKIVDLVCGNAGLRFEFACDGHPTGADRWVVRNLGPNGAVEVATFNAHAEINRISFKVGDWEFLGTATVERKEDSGRTFDLFLLSLDTHYTKEVLPKA